MGVTGHCCAFESNVVGFVNTLPHQKNYVTMLRVLKKVKAEITGKGHEFDIKAYRVRKRFVHTALTWLVTHNIAYTNIGIDTTALDWMKGEEAILEGFLIEKDGLKTTAHETAQNCDMGPAPKQAQPPADGYFVRTFGYVGEGGEKTTLS